MARFVFSKDPPATKGLPAGPREGAAGKEVKMAVFLWESGRRAQGREVTLRRIYLQEQGLH